MTGRTRVRRQTGVLFKLKRGRAVHISEDGYRLGPGSVFRSLCGVEDAGDRVKGEDVGDSLCKKCGSIAALIADALKRVR